MPLARGIFILGLSNSLKKFLLVKILKTYIWISDNYMWISVNYQEGIRDAGDVINI